MFAGNSPIPSKRFATHVLCRSFKSQYELFMLVDLGVEESLQARLMFKDSLWLKMKRYHI